MKAIIYAGIGLFSVATVYGVSDYYNSKKNGELKKLYVEEKLPPQAPAEEEKTVEIIPVKNWKQITTTLDIVNGNKWMLTAPDYDMIADSPIETGNYELIDFKAAGVNHQVAMVGKGNYCKIKRQE